MVDIHQRRRRPAGRLDDGPGGAAGGGGGRGREIAQPLGKHLLPALAADRRCQESGGEESPPRPRMHSPRV